MTPVTVNQRLPLTACIVSFIVAFMLAIMPLPRELIWLNPAWVLLVLIYWVIHRPYQCNIGVGFSVGLVLDILNGNVLGQHALLNVIISYFLVRFHTRLNLFPWYQQALLVFVICLTNKLGIFIIQMLVGQPPQSWLFWVAPLVSSFIWLWASFLLGSLRR